MRVFPVLLAELLVVLRMLGTTVESGALILLVLRRRGIAEWVISRFYGDVCSVGYGLCGVVRAGPRAFWGIRLPVLRSGWTGMTGRSL